MWNVNTTIIPFPRVLTNFLWNWEKSVKWKKKAEHIYEGSYI